MTENQQPSRRDLYQRTRDDLLQRNLSNSENRDRAILTLSSAALALSLTAARYLVNVSTENQIWWFSVVLILFTLAIVSTLVSFHVGQWAISTQLENADKYYLQDDETAWGKKNIPKVINTCLSYISTIVFTLGIITLVFFIPNNLKDTKLTDETKNKNQEGINESADIPAMERVIVEKSADVPPMERVAPPQAVEPHVDEKAAGNPPADSQSQDTDSAG